MKVDLVVPPQIQLEQPLAYVPLGLGYLGACLEQGGYEVVVTNLNKDKYIKDADIHGIQCVSATYNEVKSLSRDLWEKQVFPFT